MKSLYKKTKSLVPRRIRSFVLRRGRISSGQREAIDRLWEKYGLGSDQLLCKPSVFPRSAPIILEVGFGNGESLIDMALKHPENDYLGIDVYTPGIGHLLLDLERKGIHNIKIYCADAVDILECCIADNILAGINLFFPDPWPKKRHHKRRLVTPSFATLIAGKLIKGGYFHAATDWKDYANQIKQVLNQSSDFTDASDSLKLGNLSKDRPETKFERRGIGRGYPIWDLIFERI